MLRIFNSTIKNKGLSIRNENLVIITLMLSWGIIQLISFFHFKMRTSIDSELYIDSAQNLIKGILPEGRDFFYISYSFLVACIQFMGLKSEYVILFHFAASLLAIFCIYKLTFQISGDFLASFIATFLYVFWFKFQQWNLIVYTDAIFSHLIVISIYCVLTAKNNTQKYLSLLLTLFTTFIRPTGLGLFFTILLLISTQIQHNFKIGNKTKTSILLLFFCLIILTTNTFLKQFVDSFLISYSEAEIIYPNIQFYIQKPENLYFPKASLQPVVRLFVFMVMNPLYMLKVSCLKGLLFLAHIKPYFSLYSNLFIAIYLYPTYIFAIKGLKLCEDKKIKIVFVSFISFQILTVSLTSENWDGRFLLPILPLLFILSSLDIARLIRYLSKKKQQN